MSTASPMMVNGAPLLAWNGRSSSYVTDTHKKWSAEESFLLKVARPGSQLSVVSPAFKFEWSDHFHPSQQYYVYTGREAGDRSDGVYLRNLRTGAETTLVESLGEKCFSIPHFYKDSVLYLRSNALWRVNLDGRTTRVCSPDEVYVLRCATCSVIARPAPPFRSSLPHRGVLRRIATRFHHSSAATAAYLGST
jgi:hypothetical protein